MTLLANINVGSSPNDGTGANLRYAFQTVNANNDILGNLFPTANATTANLGNITVNFITGDGSLLTGITTTTSGLATYVTGNAQANITSVGTLTGLTVSGTYTGATVQAATIGNTGAVLTGTLSTAAQTNVTSLGTLTGLTLSGTLTGTTLNAATIGNSGAVLTGTLSDAAQTNITSVGTLSGLTMGINANITMSGGINSFITGPNIKLTNVDVIQRTVTSLFGSNTSGNINVAFSNITTQFGAFDINANVTVNVAATISSGIQKHLVIRNVNGSTQYVTLPSSKNNKNSNLIAVASGVTATFILTSFDSTAGNITAFIANN